jgi:hypothetical protein
LFSSFTCTTIYLYFILDLNKLLASLSPFTIVSIFSQVSDSLLAKISAKNVGSLMTLCRSGLS